MNSSFERLSTPADSSVKLEAAMADDAKQQARHSSHQSHSPSHAHAEDRPYYGKCQYKTGKCFNERTLKRNGEVHSLCEEHRIKQNLIQRRSDRKYQTVHAIRRRERSQRRAVLKKQVSMAVAQQLFYEHQQQKTLGIQIATSSTAAAQPHHGTHGSSQRPSHNHNHSHGASVGPSLAPSSQNKLDLDHHLSSTFLSSVEGLASPILSFTAPSAFEAMSDDDEDEEDQDDDEDDEEIHIKQEPVASRGKKQQQRHQHQQQQHPRHYRRSQQHHSRSVSSSIHGRTGGGDTGKPDDATPTGIDDFAPDSFLNLCCSDETDAFATAIAPILSVRADRELWTESDIDFLQTLLLA